MVNFAIEPRNATNTPQRPLVPLLVVGLALTASLAGCGGSPESPANAGPRPNPPGDVAANRRESQPRPSAPPSTAPPRQDPSPRVPRQDVSPPAQADVPPGDRPAAADQPPPRSLGDLLEGPIDMPRLPVDEQKAARLGIRKLSGKHLTLYTDLPAGAEIESLPRVFDLAAPQWCEYFEIDPAKIDGWRITGFVMGDKEKFREAGLLPDYLPEFRHGFAYGMEVWVNEQPSDYYRRHLLLHEGTHAFMQHQLGAVGPPWYAEGMAELLATHRWRDGKLTLSTMPRDKKETPDWGRIKIIRDGFAAKRALTLEKVMAYGPQAHLETEPYGWCWGVAAMLDGTPSYRPAFRDMRKHVKLGGDVFNRRLREALGEQWERAIEQWQLFAAEAEYGYDLARAEVTRAPSAPLTGAATSTVKADRGWQSSGVRVEAGRTYRLTASGRFQVGDQPKPWWCEPNGVTIEYYADRPLGMLLCAVRDDEQLLTGKSPLLDGRSVGLGGDVVFPTSGTLYFRINESPAALSDNQGELSVRIEAAP